MPSSIDRRRCLRPWCAQAILALCLLDATLPAAAHQFRSAYLQLTELTRTGDYRLDLRLPWQPDGQLAPLRLLWPAGCKERPGRTEVLSGDIYLRHRSEWRCPQSLRGQRLTVTGLDVQTPDLMVELDLGGDNRPARLFTLDASQTEFVFAGDDAARPAPPWSDYLGLGVEHILLGIDHLLFVTGLLLLVLRGAERRLARLLKTVTAFTLAHSLTLGATALGVLHLASAPVEAFIAASILLLALELARPEPGLSQRRPWLPAFFFGLLHGVGFAGALAEIGLPESARLPALAMFNLGVELGQLLFLAALASLAWSLARLRLLPIPFARRALVPVLGTVAAAWLIERTAAVFS